MGTPLGEFIRAKRDRTRPEDLGITVRQRRRAPGLRRTELADRAGISVEYLTRIEQGRDRNPSASVVNAIADALSLDIKTIAWPEPRSLQNVRRRVRSEE